ncbi:RICIN domain-containing protein [Streptomyces nogalater]
MTSVAALAVVFGIAVQPGSVRLPAEPAGTYGWYEDTAAEQLRQDQCLMSDVLRLGGASMAATAQDGLNQPADKLHALADRQHWEQTPLAVAFKKDRDAADQEESELDALRHDWAKPLKGLTAPGGFSFLEFSTPPDGKDGFYSQTGLTAWVAARYWQSDYDFYEEATPQADDQTRKAVEELGGPLYGKLPEWVPDPSTRERAYDEYRAFDYLFDPIDGMGADDARIFLSSGGFPRTAPQPGAPEFRIAVEDIKSRFAACGWRDPLVPGNVLDDITSAAADEWQQEIVSQATQRNQIIDANKTAVDALAKGAKAVGNLLGNSWTADRLARWQAYWMPGGVGWVGTSPTVIEVHAAQGKCLDVQGGKDQNGTPVQIYTCNGSPAQQWQLYGSDDNLHLMNLATYRCLDVDKNNPANGTKIQIWSCDSAPSQTWQTTIRGTTSLKNAGTGKCLDLHTFASGNDAQLYTCNGTDAQQFDITPSDHNGDATSGYPDKAQFDKVRAEIVTAQKNTRPQRVAIRAQLAAARKAAALSDAAIQSAYGIADANGTPRGRGLLVGQQKDQVTKGAVAALEALEKAGETAEAATRAAAGDSATITQRALAQAAQAKAEFRKEAAKTAESQAQAAADAARVHRDNAKQDKETAEARLADALKAEGDAKAAAADAHAKRLAAEAEEKTAQAEKEKAAAKRAEAAEHKKNAESEAANAKDAKDKAEAAEKTAASKRDDAVKARDHAQDMRDDAWDAEQKAEAARAKAYAKEAYADSLDSGTAAEAARAAANDADKAADDSEAAAKRARSDADAAAQASADADAAATRAEAAAKRARSDADAAQADKLKADAAVKTATDATAEAIKASQYAAAEAKTAVRLADEADEHAKDAKTQADTAHQEAGKAVAAASRAAGFAHVTAQAAVDAHTAAQQVAAPANDAIQLGSPYVATDSAAGLVVLTGQAAKSIAEQQQAVADAHAKRAAAEAQAAKNLADQAKGDAKEAYQHAADAAKHASDARTYAKEALGYAADAAKAASAAASSLTRTIGYDKQATEDAEAADKAAGRAESHAKDARASADAAELDAEAARSAAVQAEQAAKEARAAADRADTAATEAEQAAKDADEYAAEAQTAADRAEKAEKARQIGTGTVADERGSIGNVFYVIDRVERAGSPEVVSKTKSCDNWISKLFYKGDCTITAKIRFTATLDLYLCTTEDPNPQQYTCPTDATDYLGQVKVNNLSQTVSHTITIAEFQENVDPVDILFGSWITCAQKIVPGGESGSLGGCAWATVDIISLSAGKIIRPIAEALRAVDAAFVTGVGVRDAFKTLKALEGVDAAAVAAIEKQVAIYEEVRTACSVNSFPGHTNVILADGSRKALRDVRTGDLLLATDPEAGRTQGEPVTRTFHHGTTDLIDVALTDGGRLTSTPGHRLFVVGRGWTMASDLRPGDTLRTPGGIRIVAELTDRQETRPQTVYDLTVAGLHTFYAVAGDSPVLVHNCNDLVYDAKKFSGLAHTLDEHTAGVVTSEKAVELAIEKTAKLGHITPNSLFIDQQTAQQVVDYALSNNAKRIKNWLTKTRDPDLTWRGSFGARNSLGNAYYPDRTVRATGNGYFIKLVRAPGHKNGFYVQTCYPS